MPLEKDTNELCVSEGERGEDSGEMHSVDIFLSAVSMLYLRTPSMAGVQGGRVVLLHTLIHTQVARFGVTNLESNVTKKTVSLRHNSCFYASLCEG